MSNIAAAIVNQRESRLLAVLAASRGLSMSKLVRQALGRMLRDAEETIARDCYDEVEFEIPAWPLARFALLAVPQMENCDARGCLHCNRFLRRFAPDLVLSTDLFSLAEDGKTIVWDRPPMAEVAP
jgi:hypothetical protein